MGAGVAKGGNFRGPSNLRGRRLKGKGGKRLPGDHCFSRF